MASFESAWRGGPCVADLGEFGLIARLRERIGTAPEGALLLGPGDDAALLSLPTGWELVLTCDIQLDGRHFSRRWMTPREVGARAATVNLSDAAAMGGVPVAALASLGLPPALPVAVVDGLCDGLVAALGAHGAVLAGGNITASDELIVDVTLTARVEAGRALRRSGAKAGDVVFVTGHPGRAAASLATLEAGDDLWARLAGLVGEDARDLRERMRLYHASPSARITAGRFLVENQAASAAIDQSDGLGGDLAHIAEESGVRIELQEGLLPRDPLLIELGSLLGSDPWSWMLGASDDYELIFTAGRGQVDLILAMGAALELPVSRIGEVVAGAPGVVLRRSDGSSAPIGGGWDHLRRDS
jgi:thiamine-monophosphate kinase